MKILILNEKDMRAVFTMKEAIQADRDALSLYSAGESNIPLRANLDIPELKDSNRMKRMFGERVALNMPIQGTAADIIKLAMIRVQARLKAEGLQGRLVLQVHDELIVECPEAEGETVAKLLKEEMEQVVSLDVKLEAEAHVGHSWADAH